MKNTIAILCLCLSTVFVFAQKNTAFEVTCVGFYNLENLFDTLDNPNTNDREFLPTGSHAWNAEKYQMKQTNLAKVISQMGTELSPDGVAVLGVAEIENRLVLEDLVRQPAIAARQYKIVHYDSPDNRGIDCGFLYQEKYFKLLGSKSLPVILNNPKTKDSYATRDIILMTGILPYGDTLHLMVGHWPSRRGGESASSWARQTAAGVCRLAADSLLRISPNAKIMVMGDLNDDPVSKSVSEVLRGRANPKRMKPTDFYNTTYEHYKNGHGTLAYRDSWNLFDQILTSKGLVSKKVGGWQFYKFVVFRKEWLITPDGTYKGYPFRTFDGDVFINGYSDHLPVYSFLLKEKNPQ